MARHDLKQAGRLKLTCSALTLAVAAALAITVAVPTSAEAASASPADSLKRLVVELKAIAPPESWASFEKSQQRWDAYAKADCEWKRTLFDGGSIGAQQYSRCMNGKARARIAELKLLLCEGYGVAGSCDASVKYDNPGE